MFPRSPSQSRYKSSAVDRRSRCWFRIRSILRCPQRLPSTTTTTRLFCPSACRRGAVCPQTAVAESPITSAASCRQECFALRRLLFAKEPGWLMRPGSTLCRLALAMRYWSVASRALWRVPRWIPRADLSRLELLLREAKCLLWARCQWHSLPMPRAVRCAREQRRSRYSRSPFAQASCCLPRHSLCLRRRRR